MAEERVHRRLAAILVAEVVTYMGPVRFFISRCGERHPFQLSRSRPRLAKMCRTRYDSQPLRYFLIFLLFLGPALIGCTTKGYEGPELAETETAIIHFSDHGDSLWLFGLVPIPWSKHYMSYTNAQ